MKIKSCAHLDQVDTILEPKATVCEECEKEGSTWVHLRTCQSCGITLCCDSSPLQHARKHHEATQHPVIRSAEPGETWLYCYLDRLFRPK
jgi:uncharacterized UBP type Zn finger protein